MNTTGVAQSVLSISSPGVFFGDAGAAIELARLCNDFALNECGQSKGRFLLFGALPLPEVGAAIAEAKRVLDAGAVGIAVLSNTGGVYLGDPLYEPLWQLLDERRAVVHIHPTAPPVGRELSLGRPLPMIEFVFDEARTVTDLMFAGVLLRYPGIRFIVTHSGGALPLLVDRVDLFREGVLGIHDGSPETTARDQLGRLWFDSAGTPLPTSMATLADVVGTERLLFGSDYCFTHASLAQSHATRIAQHDARVAGSPWESLYAVNGQDLFGS
ncbi:MAG: amidohydrolase family protein [Leucobacter sp.]